MTGNPTGLKGIYLAAVLIVVALCVTAIALTSLHKGIDGTVMSLVLGSLGVIAGLAAGVLLPVR